MKHFRQDEKIDLEHQKKFIEHDINAQFYRGHVIEYQGKPVGLCGVKDTQEFTIAVLPEYQHKGIATQAMKYLINNFPQIWSEVFLGNPALEWYIRLGFRIVGVKERAYYKKDLGLIDVVKIAYGYEKL